MKTKIFFYVVVFVGMSLIGGDIYAYNDSSCNDACSSNEECKSVGGIFTCVPKTSNSESQNAVATAQDITIKDPLRFETVNELVTNILKTLRSIIVVLSMVFLVLGGIFYITSAGNEERMKVAKGAITASMIGLAIGVAAPSFLKEIYGILGGSSSGIDTSNISGSISISQISMNILNFLLAIVGILTLIMLIVGGIMYLTSAGDDDRIKTAKKIVTWSIIGIAVSLASLVIVKQIDSLLK